MKKIIEIGYEVLVVDEKEKALLDFLFKKNLLKMKPVEIEVYDADEVLKKVLAE